MQPGGASPPDAAATNAVANGGPNAVANGGDGTAAAGTPAPPAETPKPVEIPPRPEALSAWVKNDYFAARAANDPRLAEAVGQLGVRFMGKASAAGMLAALLAPPKPPGNAATGAQAAAPTNPPDPKLIEAVAAALAINGTAEARSILEQILAGSLPVDDDKAAADAALKALAGHPSLQNEAVLYRVFTAAEKLRPKADGPVKAEELRQQAFELIKPNASEALRTQLAKYMLERTTPAARRDALRTYLEENQPRNLGAQLILYQHEKTSKETKAALATCLTGYSSLAMAAALGVTAEGAGTATVAAAPAGGDAAGADAATPLRLVVPLWTAPGVTLVQDSLAKVESLDEQGQLVIWAGTIPVPAIRAALWQTLDKNWAEGPKTLETAGWTKQVVTDPSLVLLLKALVRKQSTLRAATKEAKEKFDENKKAWAKLADDLVLVWCDRFRAAALKQTPADDSAPAAPAAPAPSLPITLHKDAKITAQYQSRWPGDVQAKLPGVALGVMEISYVRIEGKARPSTTYGFYKRQLKPREQDYRETDERVWIESCRTAPETGRRRSIDILFTWPGGAKKETKTTTSTDKSAKQPKPVEEAEEMVIEILSLETDDPAKLGGVPDLSGAAVVGTGTGAATP